MIHRLLELLPSRTVYGALGPYLTRYTLLRSSKQFPRIYLNHFHRSDEDSELHNHPWEWAIAIILKGGYIETRQDNYYVRGPGSTVLLTEDTYHRVQLLEDESWSIFIAGPNTKTGMWYFLDPYTLKRTPWMQFIRAKGLTLDGRQ